MLDGVTILNEYIVKTETSFSWTAFLIGGIIGIIFALIIAIVACTNTNDFKDFLQLWTIGNVVCFMIVGVISGMLIAPKVVTYDKYYEVLIDDSVSIGQLENKYEVINEYYSIYTIKEKDSN